MEWSKKNAAALITALGGESVKALVEYCKESAGDVASKAIAGGVIGAAAGPLGMIGGVAAGVAASIGANLISDGLVRDREKREAYLKFLTNEHIARLQAKAVQETLLAFAGECKRTSGREHWAKRIENVAGLAGTWWLEAVNDPNAKDIEPFLEKSVVAELTRQLTNAQHQSIAVDLWKSLLATENLGFGRRDELPEPALDAAAEYLSENYSSTWKNALKDDFANDGHAYAAVSLHFFAEILAGVKENGADLKEVRGGVDEVKRMVGKLNAAAGALQEVKDLAQGLKDTVSAAQTLLTSVLEKLDAIEGAVRAVGQEVKDHMSAELGKLRHDLSAAQAISNERIENHLREGAEKLLQQRVAAASITLSGEELLAALNAEQAGHQRRLQRIDEVMISIAGIQAAGDGSPIMQEMLRLLAEANVDQAIAYVDTKRQELLSGTDKLMTILQEQLQPLLKAAELMETQGRYAEAEARYREVLTRMPTWPEARYGLLRLLITWCDDLVVHGTVADRRPKLKEAMELAKQRSFEDPHNAQAQRDLSISYNKLGDLLLQEGKGGEARKAYEDGLAISRKLAEEDPHNAQAQRDLSISYERLGDLLRQEGKGGEARKAYEDGLAIRRKLAEEDPHNAQAQRDLSVSYERLGDLLLQEGKGGEARKAYEDALAIRRKLAAEDPHNAQAQRDLSISYNKLGDLLLQEGKGGEARKAYEDGLAIRRKLAEEDPHNAHAQRDLSYSFFQVSKTLAELGKHDEAIEYAEASLKVDERLSAMDPNNMVWQQDVNASRGWLVQLRKGE